MLGIGEYASLTGLSVKALRHYDEKRVLVPLEVDELSGYRRYGEGQVRAGVVVRALREAGVPLPDVAAAVATGSATDALASHRQLVLHERENEDRAFASAREVLLALSVPVDTRERRLPAQPYVGQVIPVDVEQEDSLSDDDASAAFASLFAKLQATGLGPTGSFWTALRAGDHGAVEIICCWPTATAVDAEWCGPDCVAAVLPRRTELVATWRPHAGEVLPDSAMHPAAVALFDALAGRRIDLDGTEVRQTVLGESEDDYAVELSVTLSSG